MKKFAWKKLWLLIGIILFIFILYKLDFREIFKIIGRINPWAFLTLLVLRELYVLLKAFAFQYLMRSRKMEYSLYDCFSLYSIGLFFGFIIPGRLGDFIKVSYLKKDGHSLEKSFLVVLVDRLFDVAIFFLTAYLSMFFLLRYFPREFWIISGLIAASFVILALCILQRGLCLKMIRKLIISFIPGRHRGKTESLIKSFYAEIKEFRLKTLAVFFLLILVSWGLYFYQLHLVLVLMDVDISFLSSIVAISISSLFTLIPISISGIGTRDISLIWIFSLFGLNAESAVAFSFMTLFLMFFAALIGFFIFLRHPLKLRKL